ncbi:MAG TPA: SUMF1/EgtB/PvdO family nonheme iron enzyme [Blastocatellia bacterium]|nr:SUMF1/EgtB/PvdO family nonheme iron enzyme [Blastocatellia bacterium]
MKRWYVALAAPLLILVVVGTLVALQYAGRQRVENARYENEETELVLSNLAGARLELFKAGKTLQETEQIIYFNGDRIWLPPGNYFLKAEQGERQVYYCAPMVAYRSGPDEDGSLIVTIRSLPSESPPRLLPDSPEFVYIPSGHFLLGDRLNRQDPHYVWLTGFFINPFEVTNAEFAKFMTDPDGYANDANWTEGGKRWKAGNASKATALLQATDADFSRFGQSDQPVVKVNWYEANAFCRWLTRKIGAGKWLFEMPNEAEWEKAARGPDGFDYALGTTISDDQVGLYNWRKNPGAEITVVGLRDTQSRYSPNRYGLYHMTGNVSEWTQSVARSYNRQHPYVDDDRNHDETPGQRVVRGGSWYTASVAVLYIAYRENFQPEVVAPYLGFRIVARALP